MKKFFIIIMAIILVSMTSCSCAVNFEKIEATVITCEQGKFIPNISMLNNAYQNKKQNNTAMANSYLILANTNGQYQYEITVEVNGETAVVTRNQTYEAGELIEITQITMGDTIKYE